MMINLTKHQFKICEAVALGLTHYYMDKNDRLDSKSRSIAEDKGKGFRYFGGVGNNAEFWRKTPILRAFYCKISFTKRNDLCENGSFHALLRLLQLFLNKSIAFIKDFRYI